jgi:hypothetical protein
MEYVINDTKKKETVRESAGKTFRQRQAQNRRSIMAMLRTAGERRSDIVLFGEYANLSPRTWSSNRREYVPDPVPGPLTRLIGAAAKQYRMNVAFPLFGTWKSGPVPGKSDAVLFRPGTRQDSHGDCVPPPGTLRGSQRHVVHSRRVPENPAGKETGMISASPAGASGARAGISGRERAWPRRKQTTSPPTRG